MVLMSVPALIASNVTVKVKHYIQNQLISNSKSCKKVCEKGAKRVEKFAKMGQKGCKNMQKRGKKAEKTSSSSTSH